MLGPALRAGHRPLGLLHPRADQLDAGPTSSSPAASIAPSSRTARSKQNAGMATETVELAGHIVDSLILPKVLDLIVDAGVDYRLERSRSGAPTSIPAGS